MSEYSNYTMGVRLTPDQRRAIETAATAQGVTPSDLVRALLAQHVPGFPAVDVRRGVKRGTRRKVEGGK